MSAVVDAIDVVWRGVCQDEQAKLARGELGFGSIVEMKARESDRCDLLIHTALGVDGPISFSELAHVAAYAGRIYGPRVLYTFDFLGRLAPEAYAESVPMVWGLAEFPGIALDRRDWLKLWAKAGFVVDREPAERPADPVRLYRGSPNQFKRGFSWTPDIKRAQWFAKARSNSGVGEAYVWTTLAPPSSLLAYIHESGRGEDEWVVDARRLAIAEAGLDNEASDVVE